MTIGVPAVGGCAWTVDRDASSEFLSVDGSRSRRGPGDVVVIAARNARGERTGKVVVDDGWSRTDLTIVQSAATCRLELSGDLNRTFPASGGTASVTITVAEGVDCTWSVTGVPSWISVTSGSSGAGNGVVTFRAEPYVGSVDRTGTLTIGDRPINVAQTGVSSSCTGHTASPSTVNVAPTGGSFPVAVTAAATTGTPCSWTLQVADTWLSCSPSFGSGPSTSVTCSALSNSSGERRSRIAVQWSGGSSVVDVIQGASNVTLTVDWSISPWCSSSYPSLGFTGGGTCAAPTSPTTRRCTLSYAADTVVSSSSLPFSSVSWTGCDQLDGQTCTIQMTGSRTIQLATGSGVCLPRPSATVVSVTAPGSSVLVTYRGSNFTLSAGWPVRVTFGCIGSSDSFTTQAQTDASGTVNGSYSIPRASCPAGAAVLMQMDDTNAGSAFVSFQAP